MRILKLFFWFFFGIIALVLLTIGMTYKAVADFASYANTTPNNLYETAKKGLRYPLSLQNDRLNILLLGLDYVDGRDEESILTDSMMIVSLDTKEGTVDTISVPRDLWIDEYKTKINALYYYGKEKDAAHPEQFPKEVVEKITGLEIHHVYKLQLDTIAKVIDRVGGIDVEIKKAFTDPLFPRSGIDVSKERDPSKLYQTVSFAEGVEHMQGERALQYIRSRHSSDLEEGTDDARSARQQEIILALISTIKKQVESLNIEQLGKSYSLYQEYFSSTIPTEELVALGNTLRKKALDLQFKNHSVLTALTIPPISKYKQWVYEPKDASWGELQKEVGNALP